MVIKSRDALLEIVLKKFRTELEISGYCPILKLSVANIPQVFLNHWH